MLDTCNNAAEQIGQLEDFNIATISIVMSKLENPDTSRLIVTDSEGIVIFDTNGYEIYGQSYLTPEVTKALSRNSVYESNYRPGTIYSRSAVPIYAGISLIGCVYMSDADSQHGAFIHTFQSHILTISIILVLAVVVFSLIFSQTYSARLKRLTASMRTIREGNYAQGVDLGGNDELTVLGVEFNDLIARLQVSEIKRNHFVSDASHELKTPLASIKLLSDSILQNEMDTETIREFVGDIGKEADRLTRMSEKLLSLSRIEGQTDGDCEIIYMTPTIERVKRMLGTLADQKHITFEQDLAEDSTVLIMEDDLYQIIFNLVENAIKYNIENGKIFLSLRKEDDNAILEVRDTGVGIPQEAQEHVFERFFRVDKARARKTGGSGLGLAIVRNMVERNNGTIRVESTLGEGTTFTLSLPIFDTE